MLYISLIHALNLPCQLETCGDWHQSGIDWSKIKFLDSEQSVFKDYGIEIHRNLPSLRLKDVNVANHIRALLDLLAMGKFSTAQGMNKDFICNDKYTSEVFNKVLLLKSNPRWDQISFFMSKEYPRKWKEFLRNV